MTRQLAEDIGGGIICIAAIAGYLATSPWQIGLAIVVLCAVLS